MEAQTILLLLTAAILVAALIRELCFDSPLPEIKVPPLSTRPDKDVAAADKQKPRQRICLVTGAAGFVGKALVEGLVAQGKYDVIRAVDVVKPRSPHAKVQCIQGDILNLELLLPHFDQVETVFHVASLVSLRESPAARHRLRLVNVLGCRNVLEASIRRGVRRFVYTSTASVAFDGIRSMYSEKSCEEDPPALLSSYGRTKKAAETLVRQADRSEAMRTVALRPFLVYGEGDNFMVKSYSQGVPCIPAKGILGKVYLHNLVEWELVADEALETRPEVAGGQAYFVADDTELQSKAYFDHFAFKALGKPFKELNRTLFVVLCAAFPPLEWYTNGYFKGDVWELGPATLAHSLSPSAYDVSKGMAELGYKRKFTEEQIAANMGKYYRSR